MPAYRIFLIPVFLMLSFAIGPVQAGQNAPQQVYLAGLATKTGVKAKKLARKHKRVERMLERSEKRAKRKKGDGVNAGFIVAGLVAVAIAIAVFFVFESLVLTIIVGLAALALFVLAFIEIEEDSKGRNGARRS